MRDIHRKQDLKTEYIIRQLGRTKNKKYEMYVVTRIIHLINDFDIKFITQQYISRPEEARALTDLFFPQLKIHIEIDEPHHKKNILADKVREADIINATSHKIIRVDVDNSIEKINNKIDEIVKEVKKLKNNDKSFVAWNINKEFNPQTYIDKGYIDINDNVAFRTIADGCNCFGHNYKGFQRGGTRHARKLDTLIWFPKLFPNGVWDNSISIDETVIIEKHEKELERAAHVRPHLDNPEKHPHKRIVFAKVKDNLGSVLYRFRGEYHLNKEKSSLEKGLYWERISTRVKTYAKI